MKNNLELLLALNAKIFHDFAALSGNIDNYASFAGDDSFDNKRIMKFLMNDSNRLVNKVKFYRAAYSAPECAEDVSIIFFKKTIQDYLDSKSLSLKFNISSGLLVINSYAAKAAFALIHIICDNVKDNSEIAIKLSNENSKTNPYIEVSTLIPSQTTEEKFMNIIGKEIAKKVNVFNCREHYIFHMLNAIDNKIAFKREELDKFSALAKFIIK